MKNLITYADLKALNLDLSEYKIKEVEKVESFAATLTAEGIPAESKFELTETGWIDNVYCFIKHDFLPELRIWDYTGSGQKSGFHIGFWKHFEFLSTNSQTEVKNKSGLIEPDRLTLKNGLKAKNVLAHIKYNEDLFLLYVQKNAENEAKIAKFLHELNTAGLLEGAQKWNDGMNISIEKNLIRMQIAIDKCSGYISTKFDLGYTPSDMHPINKFKMLSDNGFKDFHI